MIYRVFNIDYCIEPEDLELNEDDYALRSDYLRDCENEIDGILEDLPDELFLEVDDEEVALGHTEEILSDMISEETGWLIYGYDYEKVEEVA